MTVKYAPYQNAINKRINGILKQEFLKGILLNDVDLMNILIEQVIKIYNQKRYIFVAT